jgi:hypothetical protein
MMMIIIIIIIFQDHVTMKSMVDLLSEAKIAIIVQSTITRDCLSLLPCYFLN